MVSACLITRERAGYRGGYAAAGFRGGQEPFGLGLAGSLYLAAPSHAGWVPLRGWLRWRYR
jgi:hypothetical protein